MQNVTTEQAIRNSVASAEMEGFSFSQEEVENVRECLKKRLSCEEYPEIICKELNLTQIKE